MAFRIAEPWAKGDCWAGSVLDATRGHGAGRVEHAPGHRDGTNVHVSVLDNERWRAVRFTADDCQETQAFPLEVEKNGESGRL